MSIVIAKKEKSRIVIGSDTQETCGDSTKQNILNCKLREIESGVYLGTVGNGHIISMLFSYIEQHSMKNIYDSYTLMEYFYEFFIWAKERVMIFNEDLAIMGSCQYIIVINNNIWEFNNFYLRKLEIGDVASIGSGSQTGIALMKATDSVEKSLTGVCDVDIYCSLPLNIIELEVK